MLKRMLPNTTERPNEHEDYFSEQDEGSLREDLRHVSHFLWRHHHLHPPSII